MFLSDSKSDHRNRVLKVPLARDPRVVSRARESRCGGVSDGAGLQRKPQVLDCAARAIGRYRPRIAGLISNPSVPENVRPQPAPMYEPAEDPGGRESLAVGARLGQAAPGALAVSAQEAAAQTQPDTGESPRGERNALSRAWCRCN